MQQFHEHTTNEGERWDTLAERYYGDPAAYERIINANPHVPITSILEGGITLQIPVVESDNILADDLLPLWKRRDL